MDSRSSAEILQGILPHFYKLLRGERNEFFKSYLITPVQYDVLNLLRNESMNLATLSENMFLDSSTLVGIVERLEKSGLVRKKVNPMDRRKNIISICEDGKALFDSIPKFVSPTLQKVVQGLPLDERCQINEILKKIIYNMEFSEYIPLIKGENDKLKPAIMY